MGIACVAQFGAQRLQPVGIAVHQRNARARGKHGPGARQPDAGGGAGDRRDLSGELHSHSTLFDGPLAQARPWETRERRARESTMTAIARTPPVIMYRSDEDRSSSVRPLAMDWMTMMPSNAE